MRIDYFSVPGGQREGDEERGQHERAAPVGIKDASQPLAVEPMGVNGCFDEAKNVRLLVLVLEPLEVGVSGHSGEAANTKLPLEVDPWACWAVPAQPRTRTCSPRCWPRIPRRPHRVLGEHKLVPRGGRVARAEYRLERELRGAQRRRCGGHGQASAEATVCSAEATNGGSSSSILSSSS
jgi:hypothetical protein